MTLDKKTEEQLKRLKQNIGVTPNVLARIAFFRSIESGYEYTASERKLDGNLVLDKVTWLGDTMLLTEQLLRSKYPSSRPKELMTCWAAHVEDGIASLRNHRTLLSFTSNL